MAPPPHGKASEGIHEDDLRITGALLASADPKMMGDVVGTSLRDVGTRAAMDTTCRGHLGTICSSRWRIVGNSGAVIVISSSSSIVLVNFVQHSRYTSRAGIGMRVAFKLRCFLPHLGTF
jgi:hypothetical protein